MADTQQGVRHQSARDTAGTTDTYDGDLRALFEAVATVPPGSTFNEAFMLWLQSVTGSSSDNINDLAALHASQQDDTYNWSSGGPLLGGGGLPADIQWQIEEANAPSANLTFVKTTISNTRTTNDGIVDFYQQADINEPHVDGMRRGKNYILSLDPTLWPVSENGTATATLTDNAGLGPNGANTAVRCEMNGGDSFATVKFIAAADLPGSGLANRIESLWMKSFDGTNQTVRLDLFLNRPTVTVTNSWQRFSVNSADFNGSNGFIALGAGDVWDILVAADDEFGPQLESNALSTIPNEYISPAIAHNMFLPGIKVFATANGNTVVSDVVVPGVGAAISGGQYTPEPATTQLLATAAVRDFTDAAWTPTNITPAQNAVGIDGNPEASTLTADAANGTIFASFTRASADHAFSVFVARKTGTGTIEITIDGGATWVDITSGLTTSIVNRFSVIQTLANPSIGFRIVTSGDEIEVDVANIVEQNFVTSPIYGAITRAANFLNGPNFPPEWTVICDATYPENVNGGQFPTMVGSEVGSNVMPATQSDGGTITSYAGGGTSRAGSTLGGRTKAACTFRDADNEGALAITGVAASQNAAAGAGPAGVIRVGYRGNLSSVDYWRGGIHEITISFVSTTNENLESLVG